MLFSWMEYKRIAVTKETLRVILISPWFPLPLLHHSKAKLVEKIKSGEDLMKISEPTFASTVWRNTTLTYLFLMHQNPYGGRECSLMQSLQIVSEDAKPEIAIIHECKPWGWWQNGNIYKLVIEIYAYDEIWE